tara:strand:- start:7214 stop:7552 length:339 start_codon:yes stop_codon:yes gene_type:complete
MTEDYKEIIKNYIENEFRVRRIKNQMNRWERVMIIDNGNFKTGPIRVKWDKKNINDPRIIVAIVTIVKFVESVFACTRDEAKDIVIPYIENKVLLFKKNITDSPCTPHNHKP